MYIIPPGFASVGGMLLFAYVKFFSEITFGTKKSSRGAGKKGAKPIYFCVNK
jgi:hypothetical protein